MGIVLLKVIGIGIGFVHSPHIATNASFVLLVIGYWLLVTLVLNRDVVFRPREFRCFGFWAISCHCHCL